VSKFKYLNYVLNNNGGDDGQIRELKKKDNIVMRRVWDLGERLFKDDFRKKMMLFLVLGVIMYGVEIWGWKEKGKLEVIRKEYVKWSLGLDSCTSVYIVYKESGTDKIRITAVYRAMKFEKALKGGNRRLLIECIKAREKEKGNKGWMEEREVFYRQNGFSTEGIKDLRERGGGYKGMIIRRIEKDRIGQWLGQRIRESNYNDRYKNSTSIGIPDYLLKRGKRGSQKIIARWRWRKKRILEDRGGEKMPHMRNGRRMYRVHNVSYED